MGENVEIGMESDMGSYSAVSWGSDTSGMAGTYLLAGYHDGTSGSVGAYFSSGYSTPSSTDHVSFSDVKTRSQDGRMLWSATVTRSIPQVGR